MSKVLTVAWREFTQTVMRKIFIIAVLGMPVVFIGIAILAGVLTATSKQPALVGTVAIVDPSGEVAPAAAIEFEAERIKREAEIAMQKAGKEAMDTLSQGGGTGIGVSKADQMALRGKVNVTIENDGAVDEAGLEALKDRVRNGSLLAVATIEDHLLDPPVDVSDDSVEHFNLIVGEDVDSDHVSLIGRRIGKAVVRVRAERAGYQPEQVMAMLRTPTAETMRTQAGGGELSEGKGDRALKTLIPMVFMMLIWVGVFTSAQHLMMSTIEEKSNRVMEVLLSAVSPFQLMAGKILGHGGVGLLIVLIYSSVGITALVVFSFMHLIDPMDLVYLAVFYVMAYFMIASMMAAVGSAVSDIREANTLVTPVMMILMLPLMLWMPIIEDPNGPIALICSFVPPASPFAMILRLAAEEPIPVWQIPASIAWGYLCVFAMVWGAGKIFRVGVLMYGKPPSPLELIKWMRYS